MKFLVFQVLRSKACAPLQTVEYLDLSNLGLSKSFHITLSCILFKILRQIRKFWVERFHFYHKFTCFIEFKGWQNHKLKCQSNASFAFISTKILEEIKELIWPFLLKMFKPYNVISMKLNDSAVYNIYILVNFLFYIKTIMHYFMIQNKC